MAKQLMSSPTQLLIHSQARTHTHLHTLAHPHKDKGRGRIDEGSTDMQRLIDTQSEHSARMLNHGPRSSQLAA